MVTQDAFSACIVGTLFTRTFMASVFCHMDCLSTFGFCFEVTFSALFPSLMFCMLLNTWCLKKCFNFILPLLHRAQLWPVCRQDLCVCLLSFQFGLCGSAENVSMLSFSDSPGRCPIMGDNLVVSQKKQYAVILRRPMRMPPVFVQNS